MDLAGAQGEGAGRQGGAQGEHRVDGGAQDEGSKGTKGKKGTENNSKVKGTKGTKGNTVDKERRSCVKDKDDAENDSKDTTRGNDARGREQEGVGEGALAGSNAAARRHGYICLYLHVYMYIYIYI